MREEERRLSCDGYGPAGSVGEKQAPPHRRFPLFREMRCGDRDVVEAIHKRCLPVRYTKRFFDNVVRQVLQKTSESPEEPIFTQVAILEEPADGKVEGKNELSDLRCEEGIMVGLVTAQIAPLAKCNASGDILLLDTSRHSDALYILTICLISSHRREGIGTMLLRKCTDLALQNPNCGVIYLHVITHNDAAIQFYRKNGFSMLRELEGYYTIDDVHYNCYLYAKFINGAKGAGMPSWSQAISSFLGSIQIFFLQLLSIGRREKGEEDDETADAGTSMV